MGAGKYVDPRTRSGPSGADENERAKESGAGNRELRAGGITWIIFLSSHSVFFCVDGRK